MSEAATAEATIASMVGQSFSGGLDVVGTSAPAANEPAPDKFEFDAEFQTAVAIRAVRDGDFVRKVGHLLRPEYFENVGEASMVNIALRFHKAYGQLPNTIAAKKLLADDIANKVISRDYVPICKDAFKAVFQPAPDLSNGDFFAQQVATFARHQAVQAAYYRSIPLVNQKKFDEAEKEMQAAFRVGINSLGEEYDYWKQIAKRTQIRQDMVAGLISPSGITTGFIEIDRLLYHKGWGRRELSCIMGGAKAGKTTALINFAKSASLDGKNVLYVTCEVSKEIISDRLDASVSETIMRELEKHIHDVRAKVEALQSRAGALLVHEFPSGTLTPDQLQALIERYKSPALQPDGSIRPPIKFDLVVVDYADIMAPNQRLNDSIENSKQIWLGLRATAQNEDLAMLTATQTNREGMKATVAQSTDVADDINKVRTIDLMISINITEDERADGEARLYFAASRNQASHITVVIKQDIARMRFIVKILKVE